MNIKQESIPMGCIPPASQPYISLWPSLGVSTSAGVGSKVNMFEQVSNNDHQMSVVGKVLRPHIRGGGTQVGMWVEVQYSPMHYV